MKAAKEAVFDASRFEEDIKDVRDATKPSEEEDDRHLARLELFTTLLGVLGLVLCMRGVVSVLGMLVLGYYKYAKFAILAHHSLHGGWGIERRGWFAQGVYRRIVDWLDWIFPMAWIVEHNKHHHYYLNEDLDPDFVERNTQAVQDFKWPIALKYALVGGQALVWKWYYYASNTLKTLHADKPGVPTKTELDEPITLSGLAMKAIEGDPWYRALAADAMFRVLGPPLLIHFVFFPTLSGLLRGTGAFFPFCWVAFLNIVGAEVVTNVHAFMTIVTNHAGADLWHFSGSCKPDTAEFFLRAVLGSTAYPAGNELFDYFHGYLNYQGEHHAFPNLSPLHYRRLHPKFKEVCAKHGVPYVQENILVRTRKTADVIVGVAKHKRMIGQAAEQPELWMCKKSHSD